MPLVAWVLEALGVPFTGARGTALAVTTDKLLTKRLLRRHDLPTPDWVTAAAERVPAGRWILKPRFEDASVGIDEAAVVDAPRVAAELARRGRAVFAERYVEGREFNLSLLEVDGRPRLLPPAEIDFSAFPPGMPRIVGYDAKWRPESFAYRNTPRVFLDPAREPELFNRLAAIALRCWRLFELSGYARIDLRVDAEGRPYVLEINANPSLAPDAGFLAAAARAGLTPVEVMRHILEAALR
ncbi:D-alanine--D-alanine ligase [bacterium HR39]|nr:D-alanine--D-alanine ligase [bacterium HR39]